MPAATYGSFSPQEDQPYSIQSTLIPQAYGMYSDSPAQAQTKMDQYWLQQQLAKSDYQDELAQQHQYAYKQLANEMAQARWKAMAEAKDPTVFQLMSADPDSPIANIDPRVRAELISRSRGTEDITNIQHLGAGMNSLSQGGFDPTSIGQRYGLNLGPYQGPAMVQAARIRAASSGGGSGGAESISYSEPPDLDAGGVVRTHRMPKGMTDEQVREVTRQRHGSQSIQGNTSGGTNLPPAQKDTGSAAKATGQGNQAVMDRVRRQVDDWRAQGKLSAADHKDVVEGYKKNGGNPIIKDGKLYGASGKQITQ